MTHDHIWQQLQGLLRSASRRVILITPFIKQDVFQAALDAIPSHVTDIDCVTRWSVAEIAAGVSDPEIAEIAADDDRTHVQLCHNLHAKLYIADERCLVGSANLTATATGRVTDANLELLLETEVSHPEVRRILNAIDGDAVSATPELAKLLREQAELLKADQEAPRIVIPGQGPRTTRWLPETRRPQRLYRVYCGRHHTIGRDVLAGVLRDLAQLDLPPGLSETEFATAVRARLRELPEVHKLTDAGALSLAEATEELAADGTFTHEQAQRAVENLGEWLQHFDEVHFVATGPWEIRQGKIIK
ncbi:phospholipase D family protein [Spirillospora sp. NPDC048832]